MKSIKINTPGYIVKLIPEFFLLCLIFGCTSGKKPDDKQTEKADIIHRLNNSLAEVTILDGFPPPVISRVFAYPNIAAYETAIAGNDSFVSYSHRLNAMGDVPELTNKAKYAAPIAVVRAFCKTAVYFTYRDYMVDSLEKKLLEDITPLFSKEQIDFSLAYGDSMAAFITRWASKDNYPQTRKMSFYVPLKTDSTWEPTPPQFAEAIEPNWRLIRPFIMDSASQFRPVMHPAFSSEKDSPFYDEAMKVYDAKGKLMMNDTASASFWDCNPFVLKRKGHVSYYVRQISPGAHWMGITQIACKQKQLNLESCCEIYSRAAIALADGFISAWETKYHYNSIRPITYINHYIDPQWTPLLETPPFPEYTSAHSVISASVSTVLDDYFGNPCAYIDSVEVPFGKAPRSFTSFGQAAEEAAISRLYGGIHYLPAIEDGKAQGKQVGEWLLEKLKIRN